MEVLKETIDKIEPIHKEYIEKAQAHLNNLTMPRGSLGRLLELAKKVAGITRSLNPSYENKVLVVMAGDHGVVEEGVSAFPQEVTRQMVYNFVRGGAAINVLSRHIGARVYVVDMGVAVDLDPLVRQGKIISKKIALGTRNFAQGPAMTHEQALASIEAGIEVVQEISQKGMDILGVGDMGIGNTASSSAIVAAITGKSPAQVTGRGTGIDDNTFKRKIKVIEQGLRINRPKPTDPVDVLAKVGGFEIGGMAGCILGACGLRIPVVIDGFISTAGAFIATELVPRAKEYIIASHKSVEIGHKVMLAKMALKPLFDLEMRLGEGTGAALAISLIEAAIKIMTQMATFSQASVSDRIE